MTLDKEDVERLFAQAVSGIKAKSSRLAEFDAVVAKCEEMIRARYKEGYEDGIIEGEDFRPTDKSTEELEREAWSNSNTAKELGEGTKQ